VRANVRFARLDPRGRGASDHPRRPFPSAGRFAQSTDARQAGETSFQPFPSVAAGFSIQHLNRTTASRSSTTSSVAVRPCSGHRTSPRLRYETMLGAAMMQSDRWRERLVGWEIASVIHCPLLWRKALCRLSCLFGRRPRSYDESFHDREKIVEGFLGQSGHQRLIASVQFEQYLVMDAAAFTREFDDGLAPIV
jgi:hypothetical protein